MQFSIAGCRGITNPQLSRDLEQVRVTSPTGGLDAVLLRADAGAAGGWEYYVYIVAKGSAVDASQHPIFEAGTLSGGNLIWSEPHLLDIHYDVAYIDEFTNYWDSSRVRSNKEEEDNDFKVEIRLVPSSPDSLLNPDGTFKSAQ